jgi:hypothetical protein
MTEVVDSPEQQLDRAIAELGTFEIRGGMERIYFNDLPGWLDFVVEYDDKGKPSSATLGGKPLDLAKATRLSNELKHAKLYYDVEARVFRGQGLTSTTKGDLEAAILARAKENLAAAEEPASEESTAGAEATTV